MWVIVVVLLVVIVVLGYFLVATPAPSSGTQATTTTEGTGTNTGNTGGISDVTVTAPKSGATVPKSFTVTGQAPGSWFFEATFPLEVRDPSGAVVGTGHATALSDWMTTDQVPFTADITVSGYSGPATLVLKKDNPSGLPQNDGSMTVPITIQ
ncbi:MAG: hypothetical protein JWM46_164 [Candidatus Kaiserbacteria bacterium]|nr:hypothetical protein [Candidatus Kaiserbacteria bacterium]